MRRYIGLVLGLALYACDKTSETDGGSADASNNTGGDDNDSGQSAAEAGNCCTERMGSSGCSIAAIQTCVCTADDGCCSGDPGWDNLCVDLVADCAGYEATCSNAGGTTGGGGGGASSNDPVSGCSVPATLDDTVSDFMQANNIPGLSAGFVASNGLIWSKGYGYADVDASRLISADTVFALMSISKVFTAVGVMQLVEKGELNLDTNVNDIIDFSVVHPVFPSSAMTTRQLLSHVSGLEGDDYGVLQLNIKTDDADVEPLDQMLAGLLDPASTADDARHGFDRYSNGANYNPDNAPGSAHVYSSIGISLAGYVAQSIAGEGFDQLTQKSIFDALGMTNTSWRLAPYEGKWDQVATMYSTCSGSCVATDAFTFADYPAGSIRSSVSDLARFLAALINNGTFDGQTILSSATVAQMREVPFPDASSSRAVGWYYSGPQGNRLGHGGDDTGASTEMHYDLDTGRGVIMLMNVTRNANTDELLNAFFDAVNANCN